MSFLMDVFRLMRTKQWIKNLFVLAPLLFSGRFVSLSSFSSALLALVAFCLVSSGVYVVNDLEDMHRDRAHPKKCQRPIASGRISRRIAVLLGVVLVCGGLLLSLFLGGLFFCLAGLYLLLHFMYTFFWKKLVLLDVGCIALGFCIRIWAGAVVVGVLPSGWLQLCVFLLSLFLGFTKRRSEMRTLGDRAEEHRGALRHYTIYFLDQLIMISATLAIVFYGLYTISPDIVARVHGYWMIYSLVFVVYGVFRYLYLVHVVGKTEDVDEILLADFPLITSVLCWIGFSFWVFYK
jgi:4-hydroxybenzoate polyprenyltransferase